MVLDWKQRRRRDGDRTRTTSGTRRSGQSTNEDDEDYKICCQTKIISFARQSNIQHLTLDSEFGILIAPKTPHGLHNRIAFFLWLRPLILGFGCGISWAERKCIIFQTDKKNARKKWEENQEALNSMSFSISEQDKLDVCNANQFGEEIISISFNAVVVAVAASCSTINSMGLFKFGLKEKLTCSRDDELTECMWMLWTPTHDSHSFSRMHTQNEYEIFLFYLFRRSLFRGYKSKCWTKLCLFQLCATRFAICFALFLSLWRRLRATLTIIIIIM